MRVFDSFPQEVKCPVCGQNTDMQTILVPVDDSEKNEGYTVEAAPVHLLCILGNIRYSRHHKLMGLEATKEYEDT